MRIIVLTLAFALALFTGGAIPAMADQRLNVVASFSILADIARQIGGARVDVTSLVGPDSDAHSFEPSPSDVRRLSGADLILVNGLGFEGWIGRLIESAGSNVPVVTTSEGVEILQANEDAHEEDMHHHEGEAHHVGDGHDHGPIDPHAWQSLANARLYARNILHALTQIDPQGRALFEANHARYDAMLVALAEEYRAAFATLSEARRILVTTHDAFGYLAHENGLRLVTLSSLSTEGAISAHDMADVITLVRDNHVPAVFLENVTNPRLLQQIVSETGAVIGGTLYSDALSGADGPAATYEAMMRHNLATLVHGLSGS